MFDALATLETPTVLGVGLLAAVLLEGATVALRFGLGWTSPEKTGTLARFTRGWRIHHLYPGLVLILAAVLCLAGGLVFFSYNEKATIATIEAGSKTHES